jgi:hypothetical protein
MTFQDILGKLGPFAWSLHNLVAHPISEILYLMGAHKAADWVHDKTVPTHKKGEGRG